MENRSLIDTAKNFLKKAVSLDGGNDNKFKKILKLMTLATELVVGLSSSENAPWS